MDEATEHKIRNLKLQILRVEKELAAKLHGANLNAFLSVGHAGQIAKASERDRKKLETKLEGLKKQLSDLDPTYSAAPAVVAEPQLPEPKKSKVETPAKSKADLKSKTATKKPAPAKAAPKRKAAPTKSAAASKSAKKPAKKK